MTGITSQEDCLACQALWAGGDPQYAHVCLAYPQCHERPVGVALIVGAYCWKCGWRESECSNSEH